MCLTEILTEGGWMAWVGEEKELVFVHSTKNGILLRGVGMEVWIERRDDEVVGGEGHCCDGGGIS